MENASAPTREELLEENRRAIKLLQEWRINRYADLISPWMFTDQEKVHRAMVRLQTPKAVVK
jgi:hypothetical protein